ncbi:DNA-binding HxlR family transcriptional regulator [Bradyrhizobium sp. LM6.11]
MVKRTSFEGDACPIARSLDAIGDWWSLLIIREARFGLRRFGQFQNKLGMAKNILSARLRVLVDHGILATAPASDGSAYQEYVLTEKGRGTFPDPGGAAAMERGIRRSPGGDRDDSGRSREAPPGEEARNARRGRAAAQSRRYDAEAAAGAAAAVGCSALRSLTVMLRCSSCKAGRASKDDSPAASQPLILRGSRRDALHRAAHTSG